MCPNLSGMKAVYSNPTWPGVATDDPLYTYTSTKDSQQMLMKDLHNPSRDMQSVSTRNTEQGKGDCSSEGINVLTSSQSYMRFCCPAALFMTRMA